MDRFMLVAAAIAAAVLIGLGAVWSLRDYAVPTFASGAETAARIDEIGSLIAARFPAATVGPAHCPVVLDVTADRTAECTLPVSGGELHLIVDRQYLHEDVPTMRTTDALFVTHDAERSIAAQLYQRFGEPFSVRCPGPDVRVVPSATPVMCTVEAPDVLRRGIEVTASGYEGDVHAEEFIHGIPTREERFFGRDAIERTTGGIEVAGSAMERFVQGNAGADQRGEVGRRGLVGAARCPPRIVLREGSHATCTVWVGSVQLRYDVHFEKGRGLSVDTDRSVVVVAALREVAERYFERSQFTGGKPIRSRVDCGTAAVTAAVVVVEPGSSVPCTAQVGADTYDFSFRIHDRDGGFRILGERATM